MILILTCKPANYIMRALLLHQLTMNTELCTIINSMEFARKALEIHDTIAVCNFSRLSDLSKSCDGVIDFHLVGSTDLNGRPKINLKVNGHLFLECQRCLEPLKFELDIDTDFIIVPNEGALPLADEESDDEEYLVAEPSMQVQDLIQDEILLAIPLAPKHPVENCNASRKFNESGKPNPFAVLANLKTKAVPASN